MVLMAERMESMPAPSLRRLTKTQPPPRPDSSHIGTRITTRQFYKVTYTVIVRQFVLPDVLQHTFFYPVLQICFLKAFFINGFAGASREPIT